MKKIGKILLWIVVILIGLPLAFLLFFWVRNTLYLGSADQQYTNYLDQNKEVLIEADRSAKDRGLLLDSTFYANQVFLLGESHGLADVQKIDQLLLLHLHQRAGLKYYIAEIDSLRADMLNRFLSETPKNDGLLKQFVRDIALRIPQQSSRQLYDKWSEIYDYNSRQPDSLKITVLGLDTDFDQNGYNRDSFMLVNFERIIQEKGLQNEKFYGLFGYFHVLQSPVSSFTLPFAARLKTSGLEAGQHIQSMICYSVDSEIYLPENESYPTPPDKRLDILNSDGPLMLVKGINDLKKVTTPHTVTLFKLDNTSSPYRQSQQLAETRVNLVGQDLRPAQQDLSTTDFFQYVLLIRNSQALSPLQ